MAQEKSVSITGPDAVAGVEVTSIAADTNRAPVLTDFSTESVPPAALARGVVGFHVACHVGCDFGYLWRQTTGGCCAPLFETMEWLRDDVRQHHC